MYLRLPRPGWILLTAVLLAVTGTVFHFWWAYRRAQQFIAEVKALGGSVEVEFGGPNWLVCCVQQHDCERFIQWLKTDVTDLEISNQSVDDGWLKRATSYRNLKTLKLYGTQVSDAGLESLKVLPHLQYLNLSDTHVTDDAMDHLAGIPSLQQIDLINTRVTADAVIRLSQKRPGWVVYGP